MRKLCSNNDDSFCSRLPVCITVPEGLPVSCGSDFSDFDGHADRLYIFKHLQTAQEYFFFVEEESSTLNVLIATQNESFHVVRGAHMLEILYAASITLDIEHVNVVFIVSHDSKLDCLQHVHRSLPKSIYHKLIPEMTNAALVAFDTNQYVVKLPADEQYHSQVAAAEEADSSEDEELEVGSGYFGHKYLTGKDKRMHQWFV
jgi:hypothetical protein